jgi:hypothetical protein
MLESRRMRRLALLTAAVIACLTACTAAATPADTGASAAANCGRIGFEPQTDNVAANIRARGTSCRRARRIVRRVYNGNREPFGYRCRSRLQDDGGLAFRHWACRKNDARVTWDKY